MYKNTLVQYEGGGYDGCFWEWNFCFFDLNGDFHNIFSSGYSGIKSLREFNEKFNRKESYLYNLENQADIDEFINGGNLDYIQSISKWFDENGYDFEFRAICPECNRNVNILEMESTGYHGNGGIGVVRTDFICGDCYCTNICDKCGEYSSDSRYFVGIEKVLCEYCANQREELAYISDYNKNQVLSVDFPEVEEILEKLELNQDTKNDILYISDLESLAEKSELEFRPLDIHNNKYWGFFESGFQLPNPNQITLNLE